MASVNRIFLRRSGVARAERKALNTRGTSSASSAVLNRRSAWPARVAGGNTQHYWHASQERFGAHSSRSVSPTLTASQGVSAVRVRFPYQGCSGGLIHIAVSAVFLDTRGQDRVRRSTSRGRRPA